MLINQKNKYFRLAMRLHSLYKYLLLLLFVYCIIILFIIVHTFINYNKYDVNVCVCLYKFVIY